MMSLDVEGWRILLCAVSGVNVVAWAASAWILRQRQGRLSFDDYATRRLLLLLSAGYVTGCAFRSAWPVYDVPRQVLFDSWLSSVALGRAVATVAELCFVAQWAVMLRANARHTGHAFGRRVSALILPMILVAEVCSWYSVLTTSNLGHVLEETIWGLSAALLVVSVIGMWPHCTPESRPVMAALWAIGAAYVGFMFLVDVPMYWQRWLADEAEGRRYLSVAQGWLDVSSRWVVSRHWEDWKSEVTWMTLYFSVAVWTSIALVHAPVLRRRPAAL